MSDPDFDGEGALAKQDTYLPGLLQYVEADGMQQTPTFDYDFVLNGCMWLGLDDETRLFETGDVVVQGATRHCWRDRGDDLATMCFVFVGGASGSSAG